MADPDRKSVAVVEIEQVLEARVLIQRLLQSRSGKGPVVEFRDQVVVNIEGEIGSKVVRQLQDELVNFLRVLHEVEANVLLDLTEQLDWYLGLLVEAV